MQSPPSQQERDEPEQPVLRERVLNVLTDALGPPEVAQVEGGQVHRWALARLYGLNMYVTLNSPEHPGVAHVLISDGPEYQAKPVESVLMERMEQAEAVVERIVKQWQKPRARPG